MIVPALKGAVSRSSHDVRVDLSGALVALVPEAIPAIRSLVLETEAAGICEVHFSLFCCLDRVGVMKGAPDSTDWVPELLRAYLHDVRSEAGFAPWCAGDLLGDHWPLEESLPVLVEAMRGARFVAGRLGALHGIVHAFVRLPDDGRAELVRLLREVAERDRSERVAAGCRAVLGNWSRFGRGRTPLSLRGCAAMIR